MLLLITLAAMLAVVGPVLVRQWWTGALNQRLPRRARHWRTRWWQ